MKSDQRNRAWRRRQFTGAARATVLDIVSTLGRATDHDIAAAYSGRVADELAPEASRGLLRTVRLQLVRKGRIVADGRAATPYGRTAKVWTIASPPDARARATAVVIDREPVDARAHAEVQRTGPLDFRCSRARGNSRE